MVVITCIKFIPLVSLIFLWRILLAIAQPGFLSIDCGATTNHRDANNIEWETDDNYIDVGQKADINDSTVPVYQQTLRVFRQPLNRSCYQLPITPNVPHLFRIWFYKGNYTGIQELPSFMYSIETMDMLSLRNIKLQSRQSSISGERILITSGEVLYICMIRVSEIDDPFVSAMELRALRRGMYHQVQPGTMLRLEARYDTGGKSIIRYPQDQFDRMWYPLNVQGLEMVELQETISTNNTEDLPPTVVMQTAVAAVDHNTISFNVNGLSNSLLLLYFAELKTLNISETRNFNVLINNKIPIGNISLVRNFSAIEVACFSEEKELILFSLYKPLNSSPGPGPMINAFEYYQLTPTQLPTSSEDADALAALKQMFEIKDWVSDACFGVPWNGVSCSNSTSSVRVLEIKLSERNFTGWIPAALGKMTELINISLANNNLIGSLPNLCNITKLERLHLQNNSLSGEVPNWLLQLPNLKELFIENNNFSGVVPQQLLDKSSLLLKFSGNPYLCMNKQDCIPSKNSTHSSNSKVAKIVGITVGVIGGGILIIGLLLLVGITLCRKKFRKQENSNANTKGSSSGSKYIHGQDHSLVYVPNPSKSRAFTLEDLMTATGNFSYKIGQGGFGSVFWGTSREGVQIAVKVLSLFSKQGVSEFLNEIDLLSRVHHKKLVSLLGYCNESRELMLVYEYMSGGSLKDHLYGPLAGQYPNLDWKTRLRVALDAAQGLEYLHVNCTPKIIHRDIKTANILLDDHLNGKLADFGLSRVTMDGDASHVTTAVKGTAGYLDPEYLNTQMLTDKSDVYSFGAVLLEIICGRPPLDIKLSDNKISLVKWVTPFMEMDEDPGKIAEIVDKRLGNDYSIKSVTHVAKLALRCVAGEPSSRPSVSRVVVEMREAMQYHEASVDLSEEIDIDYGDQQSSPGFASSFSERREGFSSENSSNFCAHTL